ncbi:MAG TPA: hypothetical protein VNI34_08920 [Candidatus Nitrosotalea sp.]|nr:hypothetical protein [Candidatus Nitrosotalea sp.]
MGVQTWDLWIPDAASRGISFGRGAMAAADRVLVHAAPSSLRVEVTDEDNRLVAFGDGLTRSQESPMTCLTVRDGRVERAEIWPAEDEIDLPVILPGGEVGLLKSWWNAEDRSEWRWTIELYNHR